MRGEDVEEVLEGVVEDDFVVLPGVYGRIICDGSVGGGGGRGGVDASRGPGVKFEVVVEEDGFLTGFGDKMQPDLDFKFAPAIRQSEQKREGWY